MILPKEKALELAINFCSHQDVFKPNKSSKIFALIAVDEIINSSPSAPILSDVGSFVNDIEESTEWWKKVKEELENLPV